MLNGSKWSSVSIPINENLSAQDFFACVTTVCLTVKSPKSLQIIVMEAIRAVVGSASLITHGFPSLLYPVLCRTPCGVSSKHLASILMLGVLGMLTGVREDTKQHKG